MIEKKSVKGDLEKKKTTFLLIGFVIILGWVYACFELFAVKELPYYIITPNEDFFFVAEEEVIATDYTPSRSALAIKNEDIMLHPVSNNIPVNTIFDFSQEFRMDDVIEEYSPVDIVGEEVDHIFSVRLVDEMPEPTGGYNALYTFIYANIKYPEDARKNRITGQVTVEFVVERDGSISNVRVISGVHPDLDKEAIRVIKMLPKWKPGKRTGMAVRSSYQIPIRFNILK